MLWSGIMMVMMMVAMMMLTMAMTTMSMVSMIKEMMSSFTLRIWCGFIPIITSFSSVVVVAVVVVVPAVSGVWDVDVGVIGTCVFTMFDLVLI
jgi:hypothetical protein